ncbi:MAG: hypothetical protein NPIRA02_40580 [Nitrospirales bacterium]|nr:MAG: hypothetical protein NPIRA02_40580 [Nitrospirales bacterium]
MISDGAVTVGLNILASAIYETWFTRKKDEQQIQRTEPEEEINIVDKSSGLKIVLRSKSQQMSITSEQRKQCPSKHSETR